MKGFVLKTLDGEYIKNLVEHGYENTYDINEAYYFECFQKAKENIEFERIYIQLVEIITHTTVTEIKKSGDSI